MESALDVTPQGDGSQPQNNNGNAFEAQRQRRMSPFSSPTRPLQQQPQRFPTGNSQPPTGTLSPPGAGPTHPAARTRLNSLMSRGAEAAHTFTSPLAQIFQPLVVDDDMILEEEPLNSDGTNATGPTPSVSSPPPGLSYGLASRRRLSSMQSMYRRNPATGDPSHLSANASPTHASSHTQSHSTMGRFLGQTSRDDLHHAFSSSPDSQQRPDASRESLAIPTADEVKREEDEGTGGMSLEWTRRMERMEERQERIEGLLERIARDVAPGSR